MVISKATGVWGDGADDATFNLEVVGNTPDEVEHFRTLVGESSSVSASFANGALSISLKFKRKLTLAQQADLKAKADADAREKAKQAAKDADAKAQKDAFEAAAQAKANELLIEQRAQEILKANAANK
jgi:hypothetical protein